MFFLLSNIPLAVALLTLIAGKIAGFYVLIFECAAALCLDRKKVMDDIQMEVVRLRTETMSGIVILMVINFIGQGFFFLVEIGAVEVVSSVYLHWTGTIILPGVACIFGFAFPTGFLLSWNRIDRMLDRHNENVRQSIDKNIGDLLELGGEIIQTDIKKPVQWGLPITWIIYCTAEGALLAYVFHHLIIFYIS